MEPSMTDIPRELVEVLLDPIERGAKIHVGIPSANFPSELHALGFEVLGHLAGRELTVTALAVRTAIPGDVRKRIAEVLVSAGFQAPEAERHGGFGGPDFSQFQQYTRGDRAVSLRVMGKESGDCLIGVIEQKRADRDGTPRVRMSNDVPLPALEAPVGSRAVNHGGGGSGSCQHIRGDLYTELSVSEVAVNYDKQLHALGWNTIGRDADDVDACLSYKMIDSADTHWAGMLIISTSNSENTMSLKFMLCGLGS